MAKIEQATVAWTINLTNIEVPGGATDSEKQEIICKLAEGHFPHNLNKPLIIDASDDDVVD
jgi:hypothetical protein